MGQDVSVVFISDRAAPEVLAGAARQAFRERPPDNLVLLYGYSGPGCVQETFPEFTAVSAWADREDSPAPLAAELSAQYGCAIAFMMADHATVGAWQGFENGCAGPVFSVNGDPYTGCGIAGIETVYGVELHATDDEQLWFTEGFLDYEAAICVFGSGVLQPGQSLDRSQIQAVVEFDFKGVDLACLLLDCSS